MLRNPNSIPETDTVIKDPVMEPFFITRSQNNGYTVFERVIKGENNNQYIKTLGYPSNFGNALEMVAREKLNKGGKEFSLKEYIDSWRNVKNSLTSVLQ